MFEFRDCAESADYLIGEFNFEAELWILKTSGNCAKKLWLASISF